jgi:methionyl-tRNA formyltransferase
VLAIPKPPWRVVIFSMILPAGLGLDALTRAAGHETVALLTPRLRSDAQKEHRQRWHDLVAGMPDHLDVCLVPDKSRLPRLLRAYEPDLAVCLGYPWLLPPEVLAIPPLGVLNGHPGPLPRWRGPFPLAWAIREGDTELALTYHLMDDSFDTGPILSQGSAPMPDAYEWDALQPTFAGLAQELLPKAFERLARGERGDPQHGNGPYAGRFPAEFAELDLSLPAAVVHRHVASWRFVFLHEGERGPLTTVDGARMRILRTSLEDPGDGAPALACADAPLWVLESEPASGSQRV